MNFRKIDAPSIKKLFLTQIEEMILSGELKPNDRLPSERELADTMGVSKTIVHEGIRELAGMGFLDVMSRKGVYVADYASTGNLDTLLAIIRYRGGMPDRKMLIDLLDVRIYLECPAIEDLARRRDPDDIRKLELLLEDVQKAISSDIQTFASTLFMYRKTLAALSGNCISPLIMNAFLPPPFPPGQITANTSDDRILMPYWYRLRNISEMGIHRVPSVYLQSALRSIRSIC